MVEEAAVSVTGATAAGGGDDGDTRSADRWLSQAGHLVPTALEAARAAKGFTGRWKAIASKIEHLPPCLSDISSHHCFSKNTLCRELLQSVCRTLTEVIEMAVRHGGTAGPPPGVGKLQIQSDLDSLSGKLDMQLRDCGLLITTGVLGELPIPPTVAGEPVAAAPPHANVRELFARLQFGHADARLKAVDGLLEVMAEDDGGGVAAALSRSNVSSLVQLLLTATSPRIRDKAAALICSLAETGRCGELLVSEGVLPPLIRLAESGNPAGREHALISLQRLAMASDTARSIVGHGGVRPLVEFCRTGNSITQAAAAAVLKNLSAVPEVRQALADEGAIGVMIKLLDCGIVSSCRDDAAECLQNLTASNESLRRAVLSEGGLRSLLARLDGPSPPESAVGAVRNLVGSIPPAGLISMDVLRRLVHVLKAGSVGAQQAAASAICKVSTCPEMKKLVGQQGCVPLLVSMLDARCGGARDVAAQAIASLVSCPQNARDVKKDANSVTNLVRLLDPCHENRAKKYAVCCLLALSTSKRCRKLMMSDGAAGYLKQLSEMGVPGSKRLLDRLERGKLPSFFSRR